MKKPKKNSLQMAVSWTSYCQAVPSNSINLHSHQHGQKNSLQMAVSWTSYCQAVPSNSINLHSHQHGQNRKKWKQYSVGRLLSSLLPILVTDTWNGKNTDLSAIQSVIIPVINNFNYYYYYFYVIIFFFSFYYYVSYWSLRLVHLNCSFSCDLFI